MAGRHYTPLGYWSKYKNLKREIVCLNCGKIFIVYPYRLNSAKYCSMRCRNEAYSKNPQYHRKHTMEAKRKISQSKLGSLNYNWRGGISREKHGNWFERRWRLAIFERDNYTCQICGKRGYQLRADHIKPWAEYPKLRYDLNNGRTLCKDCHELTETYGWNLYHAKLRKETFNYG